MSQNGLQSNIWKTAVFFITNKRSFMTILGVYLLTVPDSTPQSIGTMILFGNLAGFIFELPSGYLADKIGHKNGLVISKICLVASTACFLWGTHLIFFVVGSVLFNIAIAFKSGTVTAFMHNTLTDLGRKKDFSKIIGRVRSLGFAVPIIFIVALPFFVNINFRVPFLIALIIDLVGLIVTLTMVQPKQSRAQTEEVGATNFKGALQEGHRYGVLKYLLLLGLVGGLTISSSIYKDAYQAFLQVPIIYYGIFWGISRVIISVALLYNGKIKKALSFKQFLFIKLLVNGLLLFSLGLFPSATAVVIVYIILAAFSWSISAAQDHYLVEMMPNSNFKATILSVRGLISHLSLAGASFILGIAITQLGYASSFVYLSIVYTVIAATFYLFILLSSKTPTSKIKTV